MSKWLTNTVGVLLSLLILGCSAPSTSHYSQTSDENISQGVHAVEVTNYFGKAFKVLDVSNLSASEKRTRAAAVKVTSLLDGSHGSGTYLIMYGKRVVATAAHVVQHDPVMLIEGRDGEVITGRVIFRDDDSDLAFIIVPEIKSRTAIRYRPQLSHDERLLGTHLTYTGFPSHHDLLTIRGYIASVECGYIVTNMFGWFGSSGSGVFDQKSRFIGVVSGIDIGRYKSRLPIPLELIVWVAPISKVDHQMLKIRILTAHPPGMPKAFPGAAAPRRGGLRN